MEITLHNTTKLTSINGVPARIWEGHTASGIPIHCYITRIAVNHLDNCTEFDQELEHASPPTPAVMAIDNRLLI